MKSKYVVYYHRNKIDNKYYIGITSRKPKDRWGINGCNYYTQYFGYIIKQIGWNNFEHGILFENLSESEAKQKEIEMIRKYNSLYPNGYNYTKGGDIMPNDIICLETGEIIDNDEEDIQKCLGFSLPDASSNAEKYKILCKNVKKTYPNLKYIAVTMRESYSADKNFWSAFLFDGSNFFESFTYKIENIVERVGSGDSFAAGLIYGLTEFNDLQKALNFATASGCLKHSVPGDFNLVSKEEVETLVNGNSSGRIQR